MLLKQLRAWAKALNARQLRIFTADEWRALADFYSSKEGKSAMKKIARAHADATG